MKNRRFEKKSTHDYLTLSALKERGWTDAAIKRFLGDPDDTKTNPRYRSGPPMKLYRLDRVTRTEESEEFIQWKIKSQARRDTARQRALLNAQKNVKLYCLILGCLPNKLDTHLVAE